MPFELGQKEGELLVKLARTAVEEFLKLGKYINIQKGIPTKLMEPCGVFVTINSLRNGEKELRGCIGLPYPTAPLAQAVIEAAVSAATQDPRFPQLIMGELDNVVFEISVLTPPQLVEVRTPTEYTKNVKVGEDGLIIERDMSKGLLLPQVPVEWRWDCEEFLCQCCVKAGLSPDSWLIKGTRIYKFQAVIAQEISPNGPVEVRNPSGKKLA